MVKTIQTINLKVCPICKSQGNILYKGLTDRLYGAPGKWNFMECVDKSCGVIWLNPMPAEEDLKYAYSNYYTHMPDTDAVRSNKSMTWLEKINNEYIRQKFGINVQKFRLIYFVLDFIYYLHPLKRTVMDLNDIYLGQQKQGKLLDIGCGRGDFLLRMQELGWNVKGVDFDEKALKIARQKELDVFHYNSNELKFPENTFDLIMLNNVFEHIYNPNDMFTEIFNILKTGGNLVIITPNKKSLSHRLFKENWRGLEPPRHLQIMTSESLNKFLLDKGFTDKMNFCRICSYYIVESSYLLMKNKKKLNVVEKYILRLLIHIYAMFSFFRKDLGDLIYIVMSK